MLFSGSCDIILWDRSTEVHFLSSSHEWGNQTDGPSGSWNFVPNTKQPTVFIATWIVHLYIHVCGYMLDWQWIRTGTG